MQMLEEASLARLVLGAAHYPANSFIAKQRHWLPSPDRRDSLRFFPELKQMAGLTLIVLLALRSKKSTTRRAPRKLLLFC